MQRSLGLLAAIGSAVLYAGTVNIIPFAQALGGTIMLFLAMRALCNFGLTFAIRRDFVGIFFYRSAQPKLLFCLGVFVALQGFAYVAALHLVPISIATPLFFLFPLMTYLLQKILQRRAIHRVALCALVSSSVGVWLLTQGSGGETQNLLLGIVCALMGGLCQAIVGIIITRIQGLDAWQMLRASYLPSFLIYIGYALTQPLPPVFALGWIVLSAIVFFFGSVLFLVAVKLLGAIRTANVMYAESILAVLLSALLHDDQLTPEKGLAITLILGATLLLEHHEHRAS